MHMDPALPLMVGAIVGILVLALLLRAAGQPYVVAYLLSGIALGPYGLSLITDQHAVQRLGELGVVLLLFFIGMEINPKRLVANWRIAVLGTTMQILFSIGAVALLGYFLEWAWPLIILIGFVLSLSSTAVVLSFLQSRGELETRSGQNAIAVLLVQDLAIIPMLIIIGLLSGEQTSGFENLLQLIGGIGAFAMLFFLFKKETVRLPKIFSTLSKDHELQVFAAMIICFGFSLITGLFSLSMALGAFLAGMLVASARETHWVHKSLEPFRVVFVAIFFVDIGMMVNIPQLFDQFGQILFLVIAALSLNTVINTVMLKLLGEPIEESLQTGAMLSQIGEFGFVLIAVALASAVISTERYQMLLSVIALTLLLSPAWVMAAKRGLKHWEQHRVQRELQENIRQRLAKLENSESK